MFFHRYVFPFDVAGVGRGRGAYPRAQGREQQSRSGNHTTSPGSHCLGGAVQDVRLANAEALRQIQAHCSRRVACEKSRFRHIPIQGGSKVFSHFYYILLMACAGKIGVFFANMSLLRMLITDVSGITFRKYR